MILYFTYNDQPSGVYYSQVCDVVNYMNENGNDEVRLFALVSGRAWRSIKKKIKARCPNAIVWPMVPKAKNWEWNINLLALLCRVKRPTGIMARGVFATYLALRAKEKNLCGKVCFDGRGAYAAEFQEYRVVDDNGLIARIPELEKQVIHASDFRLAVSHALVSHWNKTYDYKGQEHVVIPCTIAEGSSKSIDKTDLSYQQDDVVLVYSGSTAGWQSFGLLEQLLVPILEEQERVHVLFLSKKDENNQRLKERFANRVKVTWLKPEQVVPSLRLCDFGILIREDTVTNQVASPTKYAEYLKAGLKVIISDNIGDMSAEVSANNLGYVWHDNMPQPSFEKVANAERERVAQYATTSYSKVAFKEMYKQILAALN